MKTNDFLIALKITNGTKRRRKENNNGYNFSGKNTEGSKTSFLNRRIKYIFRSPLTHPIPVQSGRF